jgi:hypothetical protein
LLRTTGARGLAGRDLAKGAQLRLERDRADGIAPRRNHQPLQSLQSSYSLSKSLADAT